MREVSEIAVNIAEGTSSAHAYIVEGKPAAVRERLIDSLLSGLGIHMLDIVRMQKSGKDSYKVDDANAFIERLDMGAYGSHLVGIIDDGDSLSEIVQNKLLKTLEEPRGSVIILLGTSNRDCLLSTVRSRCSVIRTADYFGEQEDEGAAAEELRAAAELMTDRDSAFHEFRAAIEKCVKTRADALALLDLLEDGLRERMLGGSDVHAMADAIELAEKARVDIERDMDKNRALKRLRLELSEL